MKDNTTENMEKAPKGSRTCKITLLDNSNCEIIINKNAKGSELFDKIVQRLNLWEKDYFGLSYHDSEGHRIWLNSEKSLSKQLQDIPWQFWFEVKFYPPEPSHLQEDITRYYLCLQIQKDIVSGKLPCSFLTYALLGSYLVQAQLGDYDRLQRHGGFSELDYLNDFRFAPYQSTELLQKIRELHQAHRGLSAENAELRYLENAKVLAMYGVDLHSAKDSENMEISLGVCSSGLMVYRDHLRVNRFAWPKILKISFRRTHFYIKIRPGEFELRDTTIGFRMVNYKAAERLWKACVEHHTFFRLMSPEPAPKKSLFRIGSSRFRYGGRTHYQSRLATALIEREQPNFQRSQSARFHARNTANTVCTNEQVKATPAFGDEVDGSEAAYGTVNKMRPYSAGERFSLPVYPLHRDKDLVEYTLPVSVLTPPQKEYYIIAPQKSPSIDVEKTQRSLKENGSAASATSPSRHPNVGSKSLVPVFEQVHPWKSGLVDENSPKAESKRLPAGPNDKSLMEEVEKITEQGPTNVQRIVEADGTIKTTTSSSQVQTVKRIIHRETVETFAVPDTTAPFENDLKNGIQHGVDIYSDGDIDHDAELMAAILEATKMNPSYTVEKIEVKHREQ